MKTIENMMFRCWFALTREYQLLVEEMKKEDGFSGLVVALILILIAVAVAVVFKNNIQNYVNKIFNNLPTKI